MDNLQEALHRLTEEENNDFSKRFDDFIKSLDQEGTKESEHYPKDDDDFTDLYIDLKPVICEANGWDEDIMSDAIEIGGWEGEFTFEEYLDAAYGTYRKGYTEPLSMEDFLENVFWRIIDSGDYDTAADDEDSDDDDDDEE